MKALDDEGALNFHSNVVLDFSLQLKLLASLL